MYTDNDKLLARQVDVEKKLKQNIHSSFIQFYTKFYF